ncbi:peptidyl-prolyl cis-trans isomerase FKBP19, chloroplastic [Momordica charantia]|uniref:peptidylprolyl isomerase n=1 Tax=Momordica charantia TaxID=3673 RepID=A0A6J1CVJ0_MOMCH|nr:peptidyl-prolyl cis-trans isomerase FKBP19, chloroplastic [Momordica charantia]XP_022145795.1 peptidyl-prolyl cis-trans isomerase FKBP19, chloroplastic [Momordica charantia]
MASISATGSLLKFPALLLRNSLNMSWRGPHLLHYPLDSLPSSSSGDITEGCFKLAFDRRAVVLSSFGLLAGALLNVAADDGVAVASEFADMPALRGKDYGKTKMKYPDYTETESGLQYKDLRVGEGPSPKIGDTVVVDWDGYTIGYYGRIFEARNKTKGGSFEGDDKDFFKFRLGSQEVIQAFEEAIKGMALGGIRRIIVPPELGYPENDYNKRGPRPTTFSGQRALDFVLRNQGLIDKTLLFDIELLKIIPNTSV